MAVGTRRAYRLVSTSVLLSLVRFRVYIRDNEIGGARRRERVDGERRRRETKKPLVAEVVVSRFVSAARLNIYDPLLGAM